MTLEQKRAECVRDYGTCRKRHLPSAEKWAELKAVTNRCLIASLRKSGHHVSRKHEQALRG